MGRAYEVIHGTETQLTATFTAFTAAVGNSFTVRSHEFSAGAYLIEAWARYAVDGTLRIRSPRLHDQVQGLRLGVELDRVHPLLPEGFMQRLFPQDTLTVDGSAADAAADIETVALVIYYEDLPGIAARLATMEEVQAAMVNLVTVENTLTLGVAGGYSGEEAIDAEFDLLKANTDYAVLGYTTSALGVSVGYRGTDTGNLRVGGPIDPEYNDETADWFVRLSRLYGRPFIPVFNAANKSGFLIDGVQDDGGVDATITTMLAELA